MIFSSESDEVNLFILILVLTFLVNTALKPSNWMEIRGIIATIATIPKASINTLFASSCNAKHAPIAKGRMKLDVKGPDATPPESKAIAVYNLGPKNDSP